MFEIDPDIRRARTLPSEFYTSDEVFRLVCDRIFARTWQLAAGPELEPGLFPFTLLPGLLDEPLLLVGEGGHTRCLSNVCTHRGKILIENPCQASLIRCGYHGRRFSLDGRLLSMPEFDDVEGFPSASDDLSVIASARSRGFTFVSLDPAFGAEEFLSGLNELLADADAAGLYLAASRDYQVNAHWALYCENYLEGFHIPYVHRSLNEIVDYGTYTTETFRFSSLQTGYDASGAAAGRYLFIFPNTMFNFYDWGLSVNVVMPVTPSLTTVRFLTYLRPGAEITDGAGGGLHQVELEDEAVVESVQKGIRSRYYSCGRYSPAREQGTHHFHRLIAEFLQ